MGGDDADFNEKLQSGNDIHVYNNCTIHHHHHHHHYQNEASSDEEQKPIDISPLTQALRINPTPSTEKPYVRIQSKSNPKFFLSVRDGAVIVAPFDPYDESQHWYKEEKQGTTTIRPFFSLVNKSTGQAIKYSPHQDDSPVQLIAYDPEMFDLSLLWMLSVGYKDDKLAVAEGYMHLNPVNDFEMSLANNVPVASYGKAVEIDSFDPCNGNCHQMWKVIQY